MSALLVDWCDFCEGNSYFDESHFISLFKDCTTISNLYEIFKYFPNSDVLIERARNVLNAGSLNQRPYLYPVGICSDTELLDFAIEWLKEQSRFCKLTGDFELALLSSSVNAIYTEKSVVYGAIQLDIPSNWIFDYIGDHVRSSRVIDSDASYALFEALYGIAADYYLAWYIASPLIDLDINFDFYFDFWKVGGLSALLNDKLLVASVY